MKAHRYSFVALILFALGTGACATAPSIHTATLTEDFWHKKFNLKARVVYDRASHVVSAGGRVFFGSSAADKLYNAGTILQDYRREGEGVWDRFTAGKAEVLWYYRSLIEAFRALALHRGDDPSADHDGADIAAARFLDELLNQNIHLYATEGLDNGLRGLMSLPEHNADPLCAFEQLDNDRRAAGHLDHLLRAFRIVREGRDGQPDTPA